ncbi:hypothetical protein [Neorhodopirellula lusitana]|uniref:hypothetical protein n=1 Tax=Neorhodopirellula lusitana TaxID=445327 RepID=UPI00384F6B13
MPNRETVSDQTNKPGRFKSFVVLVVVCLAIFFIVRTLAPQTIGEQARRVFEKQLSDHYTDWDVSIRRGVYRPGVGLQFENISLKPKTHESVASRLTSTLGATSLGATTLGSWVDPAPVKIASITVFADIHPEKFLGEGSPMTTRRVVIDGVQANIDVRHDGSLSLAGLWPPPKLGPVCPLVELHSVDVNLGVEGDSQHPVQLRCQDIAVSSTVGADPMQAIKQHISIRGNGDLCGDFDLQINQQQVSPTRASTSVQCSLQQWKIDQTVLARVGRWIPASVLKSGILSSTTKFQFQGNGQLRFDRIVDAGQTTGLDYSVDCEVQDGAYSDNRLAGGVNHFSGRFRATPQRLEIRPSTAMVGDASVSIEAATDLRLKVVPSSVLAVSSIPISAIVVPMGESSLVASIENADISMTATDFLVDDRFRAILPRSSVVLLDRFRPKGRVDLQSRFRNATPLRLSNAPDRGWNIEANLVCKGVDVQFDKFPYPVKQLTGRIGVANGTIQSNGIAGMAGGQRIHCDFRLPLKLHPNAIVSPEKSVLVRTEGGVPIDNALIAALTPRESPLSAPVRRRPQRLGASHGHGLPIAAPEEPPSKSGLESFVRSLQPRGAIELASALIQTDANGTTSRQFDLRVTSGTLRYEKFAYPLYNVEGRIQVRDKMVRIIGFSANNAGAARIACDGLYEMPSPESDGQDSELNLRFRVADLAMDHSLRVSLPESTRAIWDEISPAGTLDSADVQIHQQGRMPIDLSMTATQQATESANPNSLSIRPKALPYRIDVVGGQVKYRDNLIEIKDLKGRHDASRLIADGRCQPDANGRWQLSLDLHSGCRLIPDDELIAALPPQMSDAMRALDLRGPLGLRGLTQIRLPDKRSGEPAIDWDVVIQLEGNRIGDVGPVHSMRGQVEIRGLKDGDVLKTSGKLDLDSLHAFGFQITGIRGPFSIAGDLLQIGTLSSGVDPIAGTTVTPDGQLANPAKSQPPLVGNLFGGIVDASGTVALSTGDFDVGASLGNAKIATVLAELGQTRTGMTGRLEMNTRLEGRLGDIDLLKGSGTGRISGANLYELPLIVQTLNLLRITPTEDVAFTDGETQFSLFGEDVHFNRLTLWGDLVALDGSGTLSRQEYLDLSFNTRVSPQNLFSKVLRPLRDNSYTFWTIEVDGPLSAPTIQRRALSGVSQTLEGLFPGMVRSTTASTSTLSR